MLEKVVPKYPITGGLQDRLRASARQWRLPYWDWAERKSVDHGLKTYTVPKIVKDKELDIMTSTGPLKVRNPMYQFVMPNNEVMGKHGVHHYAEKPAGTFDYSAMFEACYGTSRYVDAPDKDATPYPTDFVEGFQDNAKVEEALRGHGWYQNKDPDNPVYKDTLAEAVYRFFSEEYFSDYSKFASTALEKGQNPQYFLSIEGVHNNVHNWIGGQGVNPKTGKTMDGHMTEVPVSAFDPIFWLHHANIDRQFAIWQELYPDSWFENTKEKDEEGTYSIAKQTTNSPDVKLRPFDDLQGRPYDSDMIRDWYSTGYTYTELTPWDPKYSPNGIYDRKLYIEDLKAKMNTLCASTRNLWLDLGDELGSASTSHAEDYVVNVTYDRFELEGAPYLVSILFKPASEVSVVNQYMSPEYVGGVYNFSAPNPRCQNCDDQRKEKALSTGQVPITTPLIQRVRDEGVTDLNNMQVGQKGREVPLDQMQSLRVGVAYGKAKHSPEDEIMSNYYGYDWLYGATAGRERGIQAVEAL
ncbi:uncharacterized protein KY384_004332 [Bacidia gigantensis]|uniref:uncharacterized protein n=1 Tax=Bacidia gigantensis TaxID=2732470 RepID=UPI001D041198|nr:uncharacterized protein KY384_004332 [Bacidia gigantensis]KAG8530975.1 hypothetical protein KY384_004332 [Bacidia gigantensis]